MEQKNYSSILDKIRTILGMESVVELDEVVEPVPVETELEPVDTKLAEATLEDGTIIYYDGEMLGVEIAVYTDEIMEVVVIDGDYVLENGDTFSIVNGVISEYIPIVVEETEPEPEEEALEEINFEEKYNDLMIVVDELKQQLEKFIVFDTALSTCF
jgi:hypothetical protein